MVTSCDTAEGDRCSRLPTGIGKSSGRIETDTGGAVKLNQYSGNGCSLIVIDLHNQWVLQRSAGNANLVATAGFNHRRSCRGGFESRGWRPSMFTTCERNRK